jgi:Aflatoxin regulatory protein/Fungal Zn(2)-Cys(6) binuclear cluster domain
MCSASKVRCDKKKPICDRCERLGYPCFFSPARRIRKRRCIRSVSPGNKSDAVEKSSEPELIIAVGDERVVLKSNSLHDSVDFNFRDEINRANPLEADDSYSSTLSGDNTSMLLQSASSHRNSNSSTMEGMSTRFEYGQRSPSIASHYDCAIVAMNILQHLDMTSLKNPCTATPSDGIKTPSLDVRMDTASIAIKRVSTILICPCSTKPDVGFLAAAVCAALLDTYEVVLHDSIMSMVVSSSHEKHRGVKRPSANSVMRDAKEMDICTKGLQDGPNEKATIMLILEELPKVANLVTQFTRRYCQDTEKCSRDLLQALAASITSRLKSMIDEVTNWIAQI